MRVREVALAHLRGRAEWYWAPALYAAAVAILYRPIWSGDIGFGWDTIETYWPDLAFFGDQIARGEWPLWNPFGRGGYPFHADPQPGIYYPVHWLFAGAGAIAGGVSWWFIQVKMLLHHVLAGATMHLFLRTRGLPRAAAVVGGLAWVVSAPWMMHKASNVLMPLAWTPLIWVAIDRAVERPSWRSGCALAAALYLAGSAGSPPGFFYTLLLAATYGLFRGGAALSAAWRRGRRALSAKAGGLGIAVGCAAAVGVALLLIVVIPGLELAEHTPRAERGPGYALQLPLPMKAGLIGLVQPFLGERQIYCGIAVAMLALSAVMIRPLRDRGAPLFFLGAAAFFLCLAFGEQTPILEWLVESVPGFGLFRIAHRYKLAFAPLYAALAGFGAAALIESAGGWSRRTWAAIASAAAVLALVALLLWRLDAPPRARALPEARSMVVGLVALGLVAGAAFHRRRAAALLVAVLALVVFYEVPHFRSVYGPIMEERPRADAAAVVDGLEGVDREWRVYDEFVLEQRPGSRFGLREFRGYPSGDPLDLRRYRHVQVYARRRPEILADFNVRYVLHGPHHRNGKRVNAIKRPPDRAAPAHFRKLDRRRYEALHPAPLVAWYGAARVEPPGQVLDRVLAEHGRSGDRRRAILEPPGARALEPALRNRLERAAGDPPPSVSGELVERSADRIRVRVSAPAPGLVVLNEVSYPGWEVSVDGEEARPLTANYLLRAVGVDAGEHDVVWSYEPPGYVWLSLLWWIGAAAVAAAAVVSWRLRRKGGGR